MIQHIRKRIWWIMAALVFIAVVMFLAVRDKRPGVLVSKAAVGELKLTIAASGLVEAEAANLSFQGSGSIVALYVREGDSFSRSQVLARTDPAGAQYGDINPLDVIRAPYDGTVVEILLREGTAVQPSQPVMRVVSSSGTWVTGFMDSEDAAYIRPGQSFRCRAGGYLSQPWQVTVRDIGRQAVPRSDIPGSSRQIRVRFDVASPGFSLAAGTEVDIDGAATIAQDALLIPTAAVVRDGPRDYVWVVEGGAAQKRDVTLGPNNFDLIQILAGLGEGDVVVVRGKEGLDEGKQVKTSEAPEPRKPAEGGD